MLKPAARGVAGVFGGAVGDEEHVGVFGALERSAEAEGLVVGVCGDDEHAIFQATFGRGPALKETARGHVLGEGAAGARGVAWGALGDAAREGVDGGDACGEEREGVHGMATSSSWS